MKKLINFIIANVVLIKYFCAKIFHSKKARYGDFTIVVISKDRPFSLRSFLLSMEKHFVSVPKVIAIVNCTTGQNKKRYEEIKSSFESKLNFDVYYEENSFKATFDSTLHGIETNKVMLCVDDQVFTRDISYNEIREIGRNVDFFTLRFGENSSYSYNLDVEMEQPFDVKRYETHYVWKCKLTLDDFNYALSFDATVFDKFLLCDMSRYLVYTTPNQLESYMNYCKYFMVIFRMKIGCFRKQSIINFVINKVQSDNNNKSLGLSLDELNQLYDAGKYVASDEVFASEFTSSHADFGFVIKDI